MVRIAVVPGNGAGDVARCNWYGWAKAQLHTPPTVQCALKNMPDPVYARENVWLPFMKDELGCGPDCIIIGHSSGAAAAMRFAEVQQVAGLVLVSAYTTDQGDATERKSGYFNRPWGWEAIKRNAGFIIQFASRDDPFLPWSEQSEVASNLGADLKAYDDMGHFQDQEFPDLIAAVRPKVEALLQAEQQQGVAA